MSKERIIWDALMKEYGNAYGVAGAMANIDKESGLKSTNLQNTGNKKLGMTDEEYTAAVDNGSYNNFVNDKIGYGICQWTYWSRKKALLEYAKSCGKSIGNLEMQIEFLIKELNSSYKSVAEVLRNATSIREASNAFMLKYERPKNQSEANQKKRADNGQKYFDKYACRVIYFAAYEGKSCSIVDALNSIGADSSYSYRKQIAKVNSITSYEGSAKQNRAMLDLLCTGKLIRP